MNTTPGYLVHLDQWYLNERGQRCEQTDYVRCDTYTEARECFNGYVAERKAEHLVSAYIWRETEDHSYVPDSAGDPLWMWTYEGAVEEARRRRLDAQKRREQRARRRARRATRA